MKENDTQPSSLFYRIVSLLGVGPHLIFLGLILEGLTLVTRRWVSYPVALNIEVRVAITAVCLIAILLVVIWFNRSLDLVKTNLMDEEKKLVTDGLYAYVRHPLYAVLLITIPPLFIIWFSDLIFFIPWIIIYIISHGIVRLEERWLVEEFGEEYLKYRQCVPALFPYKGAAGKRCLEEHSRH